MFLVCIILEQRRAHLGKMESVYLESIMLLHISSPVSDDIHPDSVNAHMTGLNLLGLKGCRARWV